MVERPWVMPDEVKEYSEKPEVQQRTDARLAVDITRAEQYVITYTHNTFADYEEIPGPIKTAVLILAEAYAYNNIVSKQTVKSESFDDYSYTSEYSTISIDTLDLAALLDDYVKPQANNSVTMRMRKL
jgi:hypothetical protein